MRDRPLTVVPNVGDARQQAALNLPTCNGSVGKRCINHHAHEHHASKPNDEGAGHGSLVNHPRSIVAGWPVLLFKMLALSVSFQGLRSSVYIELVVPWMDATCTCIGEGSY